MTASITTTTTTGPSTAASTSTHALTEEIAAGNASSSEGGLFGDTPYPYGGEDASLTTASAASTPSHPGSTLAQAGTPTVNYGANYGAAAGETPSQTRKRPREEGAVGVTEAAPVEEEWRKEWSKSNQRHYWFNVRTKQSVWHDPTVGK